jgi:transcription initiation factor IIE alpha subunit
MGGDYFSCFREDGEERARKKIAKVMKGKGMFTDEFIAEICGLETKTVRRLKPVEVNNNEQN